MIVQQTDSYIKACMQAWLFCESCIHTEVAADDPRQQLVRECYECSQACFSVVCKLIAHSLEAENAAMKCIIHCRSCQHICEQYSHIEHIGSCAEMCRRCAEKIKEIAMPWHLN